MTATNPLPQPPFLPLSRGVVKEQVPVAAAVLASFGFPPGVRLSRLCLPDGLRLLMTSSLAHCAGSSGKLRVARDEATGYTFALKESYVGPRRAGASRRGVRFVSPMTETRLAFEADLARRFGLAAPCPPIHRSLEKQVAGRAEQVLKAYTPLRLMDGSVSSLSRWVGRAVPAPRQRYARQALVRAVADRLFEQLAELHTRSDDPSRLAVAHLDIKLGNLLYRGARHGVPAEMRLGDFGSAKALGPGGEALPTSDASYPSPEVTRREGAGAFSDMWAAGVTLGAIFNGNRGGPFHYEKFDAEAFARLRRSITDAAGVVHPSWLRGRDGPLETWLYAFYCGDPEVCRYALNHLLVPDASARATATAARFEASRWHTEAHRAEMARLMSAAGEQSDLRALARSLSRFAAWERTQRASASAGSGATAAARG